MPQASIDPPVHPCPEQRRPRRSKRQGCLRQPVRLSASSRSRLLLPRPRSRAAGRRKPAGEAPPPLDDPCHSLLPAPFSLRTLLVLILMQVVSWLSGRCGVRACSRLGKFELVYTLLVHAAGAVGGSRVVHIGVRRPRGRNVRIKLHVEFVVCVRVSAEGVAWALRRCMATKGLVIADVTGAS